MTNGDTSPVALTREQLLQALDSDIQTISAKQTAAGWNHWAILGAFAALLWLALDAWEKHLFALNHVLLLTLALCIFTDLLRSIGSTLDSLPVTSQTANRFWSVTGLLGMTRTYIVFLIAKYSGLFAALFFLKLPFLWPLKVVIGLKLVGCVLALVLSFWENFPEQPHEPKQLPAWMLPSLLWIMLAMPYVVTAFAGWIVWVNSTGLTTHDLRLALLASALLYLVSLAVEDRIPTNYANAFRTVRQNLAYNRISLTEAQSRADLLSMCGTLDQTLRPHFNTVMAAIDRAQSSLDQIKKLVSGYPDAVQDLVSTPATGASHEAKLVNFRALAEKITTASAESKRLGDEAWASYKKFKDRTQHLSAHSVDASQVIPDFLGKIEKALNAQKKLLLATLAEVDRSDTVVNEINSSTLSKVRATIDSLRNSPNRNPPTTNIT